MQLESTAITQFSEIAGRPAFVRRAEGESPSPFHSAALFDEVGRERPMLPIKGGVTFFDETYGLKEFSEIAALGINWDGYGALPLSPETASNAKDALLKFLKTSRVPEITPNPNGTVSFEWTTERGHAHVEIGKTRFVCVISPAVGPMIPFEGDAGDIQDTIGSAISAVLYPSRVLSLTTIQYAADYERYAG